MGRVVQGLLRDIASCRRAATLREKCMSPAESAMEQQGKPSGSFMRELRRRKVVRTLILYILVCRGALQVGDFFSLRSVSIQMWRPETSCISLYWASRLRLRLPGFFS